MEKFIYYNELYQIYKNFINDNHKKIFELYYIENLTMNEISEISNITKSRVGAIIKNVENKLNNLENNLNIYDNNKLLISALEINNINEIKNIIKTIIDK